MVNMTVPIPPERMGEFCGILQKFYDGGTERGELNEWEMPDTPLAKSVYDGFQPNAKAIYAYLFATADNGFTAEELAEKTGLTVQQVKGALGTPVANAKAVGKVPIHVQNSPRGKIFVTAKVAQIFKAALKL